MFWSFGTDDTSAFWAIACLIFELSALRHRSWAEPTRCEVPVSNLQTVMRQRLWFITACKEMCDHELHAQAKALSGTSVTSSLERTARSDIWHVIKSYAVCLCFVWAPFFSKCSVVVNLCLASDDVGSIYRCWCRYFLYFHVCNALCTLESQT